MATKKIFGGMLGGAEGDIRDRKKRLEDAEREATGEKAPTPETKEEKPTPRPPQSKKWYE